MKHYLLVLLGGGLALSSCQKEEDLPQPSTLLDTQWTLTQLDGATVPASADAPITLELSSTSNTNAGQAPCNRYTGTYQLTASETKVQFGNQASTKMACAQNSLEHDYLTTLPKITRYEVRNNELRLFEDPRHLPSLIFVERQ